MSIVTGIVQALAYADVFAFPLTAFEVHTWLVSNTPQSKVAVQKELSKLTKARKIICHKGQYALASSSVLTNRAERKKYSHKKLRIAQQIAHYLQYIPSIELVGVSGSVAIENAAKQDDIDVFVICTPATVWATRFFAVVLTEIVGNRRKPHSHTWNNAVCLNMFVAIDWSAPPAEHDLFAAHEVLQMYPVFDRGGVYSRFLLQNAWVKNFLANKWQKEIANTTIKSQQKQSRGNRVGIACIVLLEPILKWFQLWYMRKRRTREVVGDSVIKLHPVDARKHTLRRYTKTLRRVGIRTSKYAGHTIGS